MARVGEVLISDHQTMSANFDLNLSGFEALREAKSCSGWVDPPETMASLAATALVRDLCAVVRDLGGRHPESRPMVLTQRSASGLCLYSTDLRGAKSLKRWRDGVMAGAAEHQLQIPHPLRPVVAPISRWTRPMR